RFEPITARPIRPISAVDMRAVLLKSQQSNGREGLAHAGRPDHKAAADGSHRRGNFEPIGGLVWKNLLPAQALPLRVPLILSEHSMTSSFDLTGRRALVTGSSRGLGFAMAKAL